MYGMLETYTIEKEDGLMNRMIPLKLNIKQYQTKEQPNPACNMVSIVHGIFGDELRRKIENGYDEKVYQPTNITCIKWLLALLLWSSCLFDIWVSNDESVNTIGLCWLGLAFLLRWK